MNRGSCRALADYLSKEAHERDGSAGFFSHEKDCIARDEAIRMVDANHLHLKRGQDKFFMLTLNPSAEELRHLIEKATGKVCDDFRTLPLSDRSLVYAELREYARQAMDNYAACFNREGISSGGDLVYFAKIESKRHYSPADAEVRSGLARAGSLKPGLQLHVHVCVSRNSRDQKHSLSPLGGGARLKEMKDKHGRSGFNKAEWAWSNAREYRERYGYTDPLHFSAYANGRTSTWKDNARFRPYVFLDEERMAGMRTEREKLDWYYSVLKAKRAANATRFMDRNLFNVERQTLQAITRIYRFAQDPVGGLFSELLRLLSSSSSAATIR